MKIGAITIVIFLMTLNAASAQSASEKWPTLNQFHEVLSQTFHPAESGNYAPIKARSEELYFKSVDLLKLNIPEEYRTQTILGLAEKLQLRSRALNKRVSEKAADTDIMKSLNDVHNTYHELEGMCSDKK